MIRDYGPAIGASRIRIGRRSAGSFLGLDGQMKAPSRIQHTYTVVVQVHTVVARRRQGKGRPWPLSHDRTIDMDSEPSAASLLLSALLNLPEMMA